MGVNSESPVHNVWKPDCEHLLLIKKIIEMGHLNSLYPRAYYFVQCMCLIVINCDY